MTTVCNFFQLSAYKPLGRCTASFVTANEYIQFTKEMHCTKLQYFCEEKKCETLLIVKCIFLYDVSIWDVIHFTINFSSQFQGAMSFARATFDIMFAVANRDKLSPAAAIPLWAAVMAPCTRHYTIDVSHNL